MSRFSHTAIILAAGASSRLGPVTRRMPKTLLRINGRSLLDRMLRAIAGAGVRQCLIVTGFESARIETACRDSLPVLDVRIVRNDRFRTTGNNSSLRLALSAIGPKPFLLLDSDILFAPGLIPLLLDAAPENALILRHARDLGTEEIKVDIDGDGRVRRIGKDVPPGRAAGESIGIEKFGAAASGELHAILERRSRKKEFYEAAFQELVDRGEQVYAVPAGTLPCIEIDTPADLQNARRVAARFGL